MEALFWLVMTALGLALFELLRGIGQRQRYEREVQGLRESNLAMRRIAGGHR